ncbi:hypothetical protein ACFYST_20910 [Kitasatospora sp. NPDC004614]|uniref:hypothetical protein n=1 Tax=unclassified Kitasatospora TaxID=2633591 RepID=UPI00369A3108
MGFSGSFVVARVDRPLNELASVRAAGAPLYWLATDGAWQILQMHTDDKTPDAIVAETGGPVLEMHVHDSDLAWVEAKGLADLGWRGVLSPEMARDHQVPEWWIGEPDEVGRKAVAWAEEAGLRPDPAAVRAALVAESDPFAEDLIFALVKAMGLRFGPGENLILS